MERYSEYKETGIDWIGQIPTTWKRVKIKYISEVLTGSTPKSSEESYWGGEINWVTTDDLGKLKSKFIEKSRRKITEEGFRNCGTTLAPVDSIILSTRAPIGHIGILNVAACTNQGCKTLVASERFNSTFLYFQLLANKNALNSYGVGTTFKELPTQSLRDFEIAIPEIEEQTQIANYLDTKTAEIDNIIAAKKKLIALYEEEKAAIINQAVTKGINPDVNLKPSGVEWLGDIPEHWEVKPLKYLIEGRLKYGANESADEENLEDPRYIRITDFGKNGKLRKNTFKSLSLEKAQEYLLNDGDILFARSGATVGKTFQFKNYSGQACFAGYLIKATPKAEVITSDFLYNFTKSPNYDSWKNSIFNQATIQNIGADKYAFLLIGFPSIEEQNRISDFVRVESDKINSKIKKAKNLIELLTEYRTTLISEVVTGKIKVTA